MQSKLTFVLRQNQTNLAVGMLQVLLITSHKIATCVERIDGYMLDTAICLYHIAFGTGLYLIHTFGHQTDAHGSITSGNKGVLDVLRAGCQQEYTDGY